MGNKNIDLDEWNPFKKRGCYDCAHLKSAIHWWCSNSQATYYRGTSIPGCIKCPFWSPDWSMIKDEYKTEENGYVKPIKKLEIGTKSFFDKIKTFFKWD